MNISFVNNKFIAHCTYDEHSVLKDVGFNWDLEMKRWTTEDVRIAEKLVGYCDEGALYQINWRKNQEKMQIAESSKTESNFQVKHPINIKPFPYQLAGVEYMMKRKAVLLADAPGLGKAQSVNETIITPFGKKRLGDIKVGDYVTGSNGRPTKVIGVYPQGKRDLYRITFSDGFYTLADKEHLWHISARRDARELVLTTGEMIDKKLKISFTNPQNNKTYTFSTYYKQNGVRSKWQIPVVSPIEYDISLTKRKLLIEPYLLGVLLGNGSFRERSISLCMNENDFDEVLSNYNFKEASFKAKGKSRTAYFSYLLKEITQLGLNDKKSNSKFIPETYKYASIKDRLSLLQGLMDTDGTPLSDDSSGTEYSTVSKQLCEDICELVHSLGGIVRVKTKIPKYTYNGQKKIGQKSYRLNIKLPEQFNPFRLKRKVTKYVKPTKYPVCRYIKDIRFEKKEQAVCIKVDAPNSLYVCNHAIVTHNTGQTLLCMNMRPNVEAIIVCPSVIKMNWLKEARKWLIGDILAYIYEPKKIRYYKGNNTPDEKKTVLHIINYELLKKHLDRLKRVNCNLIVIDEAHKAKNKDSIRSKLIKELSQKAFYKILITGTPIYNKPKDLFALLNILSPSLFRDFFSFAKRYCAPEKVWTGKQSITKYDGASNMDELNTILRSNFMIRRLKEDVLKDLPKKMRSVITLEESSLVPLVKKEKETLEQLKNNTSRLKEQIEKMKEYAGKGNQDWDNKYKSMVKELKESKMMGIGEISKIRHELAVKKVPYVADFVREQLEGAENDSRIVVFAHHTDVCELLMKELAEYHPTLIIGSTKSSDRQQSIAKFANPYHNRDNKCRVFIGSMGACSTGVDGLQKHCNTVVFAELDWTPSTVEQAEDRLQRIGQKNTVWVYHVVADQSLDSKIAKMLVEKNEVSHKILDAGVETAQIFNNVLSGKI